MTRGKLLAAVAVGSALCALASPASAAGFVNGSFETNTCGVPAGSFTPVGASSPSCITGWDVSPHSVDLVDDGFWEAFDGQYSVDLAGNAPGAISQLFDTIVGGMYTVEYYISGNPDGSGDGDGLREGVVQALINGNTVIGGHSLTGIPGTRADMDYRYQFFTFNATTTQTRLTFRSNNDEGAYGAVIDAVNVIAPVPEPATWAMMLLGFGAIGFGLRKRNAQGQSRLRVAYA